MIYSVTSSLFLHIIIILIAVVSLPIFSNERLDTPPIIQVELIEISEKTNVPEISKKQKEKTTIEKEIEKKDTKINQPIMKPKEKKSSEKVLDPAEEELLIEKKIEEKMIQNMPLKKPILKKKDKFDPLKIAELIDQAKDTQAVEEIVEDLNYDSMDSTPSLDKKLTLSEEDAIRAQFMQCWSIPLGIPFDDTMIVKIKIFLDTDGSLARPPEVVQHERMNKPSEKYFRTLAESALRAVRRCDPIKVPDITRYDNWKNIQLNFDPREILRG